MTIRRVLKKWAWLIISIGFIFLAVGFRFYLLPSLEDDSPAREVDNIDGGKQVLLNFTTLSFDDNAKVPTLQSKQQFYVGDYEISSKSYVLNADSPKLVSTPNIVLENVYAKPYILNGFVDKIVYLKKEKQNKEFLDTERDYFGLIPYSISENDAEDSGPVRIGTEGRFVADYDLSNDGSVVGLLEYDIVETVLKKASVCKNCVELSIEVYYVNYDLLSNTVIENTKIDMVNVLIDEVWYKDIKDFNNVDLLTTNINSVHAGGEGDLRFLLGNELIDLRVDISPSGKEFIYENNNLFIFNRETSELIELSSNDDLGNLPENVGSPPVPYIWVVDSALVYEIVVGKNEKQLVVSSIPDGARFIKDTIGDVKYLDSYGGGRFLALMLIGDSYLFGTIASDLRFNSVKEIEVDFPEGGDLINIRIINSNVNMRHVFFSTETAYYLLDEATGKVTEFPE